MQLPFPELTILHLCTFNNYLIISVWWTESLRWNTWLLTAKLCSSLKGARTIPSRTGKVKRITSVSSVEIKHYIP